jgi:hypothetical protein
MSKEKMEADSAVLKEMKEKKRRSLALYSFACHAANTDGFRSGIIT